MTFNDKIDIFMKENNIENLKQLALSSEIPYTTLKDFYDKESADNSRLSTIRKLSNFMGCSMDYLAYDDITDFNYNNLNKLNDLENKKDNDLNILDNVLYSSKDKIDSVKNLPVEKQEVIANAVKSVLDLIDDDD